MKFRNARVGDKVWSLTNGPGEICDLEPERNYPIVVEFPCTRVTYTFRGCRYDSDSNPDLYWTPRQIVDAPDPEPRRLPDLDVDDKVYVRRGGGLWRTRHFSHWSGPDMMCFEDGRTSWSTKQTTLWPEWKLPGE